MSRDDPRFLAVATATLGLLAWGGEASGLLAPWALPIGAGLALVGNGPLAARGLSTLVGAVAATGLLGVVGAAPQDVALVRVAPLVGVLVLGAVLAARPGGRWPAWAALVGAGAVLAVGTAGHALETASPVVAGLIGGALPFLVREVWADRTERRRVRVRAVDHD
jgi:hypothetical protein